MYYIRFLKTPKIVLKEKRYLLNAVVTVTSDLGERFFENEASLDLGLWPVNLNEKTSSMLFRNGEVQWRPGMRALPISFEVPRSCTSRQFKVSVSRKEPKPGETVPSMKFYCNKHSEFAMCPVWSAPLYPAKGVLCAQQIVERTFERGGRILRIWEETGNSIARHIWDAGLAFTAYLDLCKTDETRMPLLQRFLAGPNHKSINILELGTGCGLAGICVAGIVQNCHVVMTDLPEAQDIARRNLSVMECADSSTAEFKILDWEKSLPHAIANLTFDMIIVTDCTYNPDSSPALVKTLSAVSDNSPNVVVFVAMKVRHPSEAVFFPLMVEAGFVMKDHDRVDVTVCECNKQKGEITELWDPLPSSSVDIYAFTR